MTFEEHLDIANFFARASIIESCGLDAASKRAVVFALLSSALSDLLYLSSVLDLEGRLDCPC